MGTIDETMLPMLEAFIFESFTLLDQLDEVLLDAEQKEQLEPGHIDEIFRIMHTVKGSAAMMGLETLSEVTHKTEDMFFLIRDDASLLNSGNFSALFDLVFSVSDFVRQELTLLQQQEGAYTSSDAAPLLAAIRKEVDTLRRPPENDGACARSAGQNDSSGDAQHIVRIFFDDETQMENVRAFMVVNALKDIVEIVETIPPNPETTPGCIDDIVKEGFVIKFNFEGELCEVFQAIEKSPSVASYEHIQPEAPPAEQDNEPTAKPTAGKTSGGTAYSPGKQSLISVHQSKLDELVNIMGEIVIAESMVESNPDLEKLELENFNKSIRHLRKLTNQLQDIVMGLRMVPISGVFQRMQRIVRDMNRNLGKATTLVISGGDTEVDKNIIDALGDPLMHMIRNSMDHGIETPEIREQKGKDKEGTIHLTAKNVGSDIIIELRDDGAGLDRETLLNKAETNGLLTKAREEYTDKEVYNLIMVTGFSTTAQVTEYSGRGVGLDVVKQGIEKLGGTVSVDSSPGQGTVFSIKIPLSLAIVDGMEIAVADETFTIPITSINQIYKFGANTELLYDTDGTEMVMIRDVCYPIIRLHTLYGIDSAEDELEEGILILVESGNEKACVFADRLIGEHQVVVKSFPHYFDRYHIENLGFSGCTIMGDGTISLILDVNYLLGAFTA